MKILVPTDFSEHADYAFQMAILFAKKLNAEIHLFHVMEDVQILEKYNFNNPKGEELLVKIRTWSAHELKIREEKIREQGVNCEAFLDQGSFLDNLKYRLKHETYVALIMGSNGISSTKEWFLGSNTSKAIKSLHQNVLVVKELVTSIDFSEVVFVTGLDIKERECFKIFLDFIKPFDVKEIHVLAVDTHQYYTQPTGLMEAALADFKLFANDPRVQTHFYSDSSVQKGIDHFSTEYNIDLIGISNHMRHPVKRLFQRSNVELLVHKTNVPILSIDYK